MEYPYRAQAQALRQAANDPRSDMWLIHYMLETAAELEAEAEQQEQQSPDTPERRSDPMLNALATGGYYAG
jgi:hypothetical protein